MPLIAILQRGSFTFLMKIGILEIRPIFGKKAMGLALLLRAISVVCKIDRFLEKNKGVSITFLAKIGILEKRPIFGIEQRG